MIRTCLITLMTWIGLQASYLHATVSIPPTDVNFDQALVLLQKGQYESAGYYMDAYVRMQPHTLQAIEAQYYAALCAVKLNQSDKIARLQDFIQAHPTHYKTALARYELGNAYAADQAYTESIAYYLSIDTTQLDQAMQYAWYYQLGYAYLNEKNFEDAYVCFNKIKAKDNPYQAAANYYAGYMALKQGNYDAALADLKKAGENESYQTIVPYLMVEVFYQQKRFKALIAYVSSLADITEPLQNSADIELLTADAYYFLGQYSAAVQHYEAYINVQEAHINQEIQYRLAYALAQTGEITKAFKYFKAVALQKGRLAQLASYQLGKLYVKTKQKQLAITAFDQARQKNDDPHIQADARFQYAKLNYELGNWSVTIAVLEKFQQTYPTHKHNKEAHSLLSEAYLRTNNYDLAIAYIERLNKPSVDTRKVYQQVTLYKGQACFNEKAYEQAEHWFKKSLAHAYNPQLTAQAHLWLGETASVQQHYEQAITHYQPIINQYSQHTAIMHQAIYGLAYAYFYTQDYEHALAKFKAYTQQTKVEQPSEWMRDAKVRMADCYYILKSYKQALSLYDETLGYAPAHSHYQKGLIYAVQGDIQAAYKNWKEIEAKYQQTAYYEKALYEYAYWALQTQDYPLAVERFSKFIQQKPHSNLIPDALLHRAIAAVNVNQHKQAADDYKAILKTYPQHRHAASALLELPKLLVALGESEQLSHYLAHYEAANPSSQSLESISFETAKSLFYNQDYTQAITQLTRFISQYSSSGLLPEAYFLIAEAYYRLNDNKQALHYYQIAIKGNKINFYNKALLRIASIAYSEHDYQTALIHYEQLKLSASNKKENYYALEGTMKASYALQQYDKAKQAAALIQEQGNITVNATDQALLYLGKTAMQQGDKQQAIAYFKQLLVNQKDSDAAEAQYLMAQIYYQLGEYQQSLETLFDLNKQFAAYPHWVNQSFLLIADNYIALKELFQAKATLQSIITNATDAVVIRDAEQKLMDLNEKINDEKITDKGEELATDHEPDTIAEAIVTQEEAMADEAEKL